MTSWTTNTGTVPTSAVQMTRPFGDSPFVTPDSLCTQIPRDGVLYHHHTMGCYQLMTCTGLLAKERSGLGT